MEIKMNRDQLASGMIPNNMKMIIDTYAFTPVKTENVITERINGQVKTLRLTGIFQEADSLNSNNRIYPYNILNSAITKIQKDISERKVVGELDHPSDAKINLDRVSHVCTKLWMDGRKVYGEAEILGDLPCGVILKGLVENKIPIGVSSRGVGDMEIKEDNGREISVVCDGYTLITWDTVAQPSVSAAIMKVCTEGKLKYAQRDVKIGKITQQTYEKFLLREIRGLFR